MKPLGRDHWHRRWPLIKPALGHLCLDEVTTLEMDKLEQSLPAHYAQSTEVYAHLGSSAQLRLVKALEPASPSHRGQYLVNESQNQKSRNA
jgi:hypothetical protein